MWERTTGALVGLVFALVLAACAGPAGAQGDNRSENGADLDCSDPLNYAHCQGQADAVGFVPGEMLSSIPVYPEAEGSSQLDPDSGPPSFPGGVPMCHGPRCPELQTASRQFAVEATAEEVLGWYQRRLADAGYARKGGGFGSLRQGGHRSWIGFYLPQEPNASVQVHTYTRPPDGSPIVFEVMVTNLVPLPRPEGQYLPADVSRVEIEYTSGGKDADTLSSVVTEAEDIKALVRIVNRMPVRADWVYSCPIFEGPPSSATLRFYAEDGESWTVRSVRGCPFRVEFGPYPDLEDRHNLLWSAMQQALGVGQEPDDQGDGSEAPLPVPGVVPTPQPTSTSTPGGADHP